jgi:NAD(P)-dependent dehydrogenase (short-subunit alcohol dehydrogenase family)
VTAMIKTLLPAAPSFRLDGRRALVTGAGRGIGLAASAALASAGAEVLLCSRTTSEVFEAAAAITAAGGQAEAVTLDVTNLDAVTAMLADRPPVDILVNNAGMNRLNFVTEVSVADFDAVMTLNVRASYFLAQSIARRLIETGRGGSLINISSQMGHVGGARRSLYCASKWAMEGFTKAMAIDLAPYRIRVNTLCPTFIETPMTEPFFENAEFKADVLSRIKLGRLGTVEDLMGAVVFLACDASALMTGSSLIVDGGWTAE